MSNLKSEEIKEVECDGCKKVLGIKYKRRLFIRNNTEVYRCGASKKYPDEIALWCKYHLPNECRRI